MVAVAFALLAIAAVVALVTAAEKPASRHGPLLLAGDVPACPFCGRDARSASEDRCEGIPENGGIA
ncbi:hypothetical protein CDO52_00810 [Nocardiopsis gilva YIM 90087]|uniref:Uncharacterized protein n=1 Tax=Nocardiopsis gilva YIM 90087 TaxID=1235441 RepID=A0A223S0H0_9ACTN|nr:hypothetical protein [Nocardiopsis gilva]ASU81519.1 hypothetical protein CDO52_00810 [Nocardiopsis gilva YIM 90087]